MGYQCYQEYRIYTRKIIGGYTIFVRSAREDISCALCSPWYHLCPVCHCSVLHYRPFTHMAEHGHDLIKPPPPCPGEVTKSVKAAINSTGITNHVAKHPLNETVDEYCVPILVTLDLEYKVNIPFPFLTQKTWAKCIRNRLCPSP